MSTEQAASSVLQTLGAWGAALVAGAATLAALVRRRSRDRTEIAKDRVEESFVIVLLKERDQARADLQEARQAHQLATEQLARVTSDNASQGREIRRLGDEFRTFQRRIARLYPSARQFLDSDIIPLQETHTEP